MPTPTYSDYTDEISSDPDNVDAFGSTISYSIVNSQTALGGISYYPTTGNEYNNFASAFVSAHPSAVTNIDAAILDITAGSTDPYAVLFSNVANITFNNTDANSNTVFDPGEAVGNIVFGLAANTEFQFTSNHAATSVEDPSTFGSDKQGDIWINTGHESAVWTTTPATNEWLAGAIVPGTPAYAALIHEIGHSLGLDHPADVNPSTLIDSQQYSIMSYNYMPSMVDTSSIANSVSPHGLQLFDIAALQSVYGINWGTRSGDNLYCNTTAFTSSVATHSFVYTIWDGGGTNLIDTTGFGGTSRVDLRQGKFSSIGEDVFGNNGYVPGVRDLNNVAIAFHTLVQNAIATQDNSVLVGNQWSNILLATGTGAKIYGDGIGYDGDAGFVTPIPGDSHDPNNSIPTIQNDILIGGLGATTFYSGLGSDVIVAYYDKTTIDSATSSWSTYWDTAGQFTGANNATGSALADLDPGPTYYEKTVDYSALNAAENVAAAGGSLHIEVTITSSYITVDKDTATATVGTDHLYGIDRLVGTSGNDTFAGDEDEGMRFYGSAGTDTYDVGSTAHPAAMDYSMLDALGTNAHIAVTASSSGYTIDKTDDNGSLGEDTVGLHTPVVYGTGAGDSFSGFIVGGEVDYYGGAGSDTYSFNMLDLAAAPHAATVVIGEEGTDSFSTSLSVSNFDLLNVLSYTTSGSETEAFFEYQRWDSAISAYDDLYVTFIQQPTSVQTLTAGTTTFVFGTYAADIISGASGDHSIYGGGGSNTMDYSAAPAAITANLATGTVANGWGYTDTLHDIANVIGSAYNDSITGDANANVLSGGAGNDTLSGGGGDDTLAGGPGNNSLDGGSGVDTVDFSGSAYNVTVSLAAGTAHHTDGNDTLSNIENVIGSSYGDIVTGNSGDNVIDGGAGDDWIQYFTATSGVTVNLVSGTATGDGNDTLLNIENAIGSPYNDTLIGNADNQLYGGAGNDTLEGGTAVYFDPTGVTVNLLAGTATDGLGGTDTLIGIHAVVGSGFDDTITGDSAGDTLSGGDGNDTILAGSGNDILDGGTGTNTVSYANAAAGVTVDLSTTAAQDTVGAGTDTVTNFANLTGSAHDDILTGDSNANVIDGGAGNDIIQGGGGNDTLTGGTGTDTASYDAAASAVTVNLATTTAQNTGGAGTDTISGFENLTGSAFNDTLTGDANANVIDGHAGNDTMNGAGGTDTLSYASATGGITISLAITTGQATGGSGTDTISNFENLTGSAFNDTLTGSSGANVIDGGAGNDIIQGGAGNDTLIGGLGIDTDSYAAAASAVTVNLATLTAQNTVGAGTDTISGFENLTGSAFNDTLTGDGNDNVIDGGAGSDTMNGAGGIDTLTYATVTAGITMNLAVTTGQATGGSGTDTISNFENLIGSNFADTLTGNSGNNIIEGLGGNDVLDGKTGTDTVSYEHATGGITISLAIVTQQATGGAGNDFISNFENLTGSGFNDTLTGSTGNNVIEGLGGNDTMNGGSGTDTVSYEHATAAVTVSLATTSAQNTFGAGTDTISNFENLTGSAYDDTLTGSSGVNTITGGDGNDMITGGGGADNLYGGNGSDTFLFLAATALGASVNVQDFVNGAGNDKIDIKDVISGYDPATMAVTDWVQITTVGSDSILKVDIDGTGTGHTWQQIATIVGVTGLTDEAALVASGNLVVH